MNLGEYDHEGLIVLIATAGGGSELNKTLSSLESCNKPESYLKTIIVENGGKCGAESIVQRFGESLPCEYRFVERANKSFALNEYLGSLQGNHLVYFSDDDIEFDSEVLIQIESAARCEPNRAIFGGCVRVKSDAKPKKHLVKYLPGSMAGFPRPGTSFDPGKDLLLGANWAAFSDDIKSVGGFDPRFGPGSPFHATGQESEIMKKLRSAGLQFVFVESAIVWHSVESERFCEEFIESRMYRAGVQSGLHARINMTNVAWKKMATYQLKKFSLPTPAWLLRWMRANKLAARLRFSASHARGFVDGYNANLD